VSARDLPVRQLAALLAFCGVFVGNDSGVSHLAAAWGAPTLAIFGPTDACTWRPDDAHVEVLVAKSGRVADVEVARVVATARRLRLSDPRREPECALPGKLPAIPTSERP
jgi:ADP-heptose:LPS heptosyltransferase